MLSTNYFVIYSAKGEQIEDFFRNCQDDGTWIVCDLLARDNFVIITSVIFLINKQLIVIQLHGSR
jgi:hypothetical protein